ncbi:MAG: hypothetical protein ACYDAD_10540 [Acidimicrobiales bacterium]
MTRISVLDPTAPPPTEDVDPGPDAGALAGAVVGLRYDRTWRSFEWVVEEWAGLLCADGAVVRPWCAGNRIGSEGERTQEELGRFTEEVDLAVVGLGN